MRKCFYLLFVLVFFVLFSCENAVDEVAFTVREGQISVFDTPDVIDREVAVHVANIYGGAQTKGMGKTIEEIIPVNGDNGETLLYVINYKNNQGFIIISATNQYLPVLAYNENGHFEVNVVNGASVWLEEQQTAIQNLSILPDSIRLMYKQQWNALFTKKQPLQMNNILSTKVIGESFEEEQYRVGVYIENALNEWGDEGYQIYPYMGVKEDIFDDNEINEIERILLSDAEDRYFEGFSSSVYVRIKSTTTNETVNPLLNTTWHQTGGYAAHTPNNYPAGCGVVAVGQIMKYHEYPVLYDWDAMANTYATDKTALLFAELGEKMHAKYTENATSTNINDAVSVLKSYGYTSSRIINHNGTYTLKNQLYNGWPVFMQGFNSANEGHGWVCDGYKSTQTTSWYEVMALDKATMDHTGNPEFRCMFSKSDGDVFDYYHMNFGWGGSSDGYYLDNNPIGFSNNRKDIVDIYPN